MNKFQELMESIDILLKSRLRNVTKVHYGIAKEVNGNNCTITLRGKDYILPFYGNIPIPNKRYPIVLPQGSLSQAFTIG